jgi:trigger factor
VLNIETEILDDRQAKLVVTVEPDRVQREMQAAAKRLSKRLNIPGFRKGKAPLHVLTRYLGEGAILEEALDPLGQEVYKEALESAGLEPYAPGSLSDIQTEPMLMTFMVPLQPEVELGNYRDVRVPYEAPAVSEDDVQRTLTNLREEKATLTQVERSISMGDVAVLDILGTIKQGRGKKEQEETREPLIDRKAVRVLITEAATYPVPGFPVKVVGMDANEERSFDIKMPKDEDYDEEIRGKTIQFQVVAKEVYSREVPDLDEAFATELGDYESLDDLRAKIREQLTTITQERVNNEYMDQVFDKLAPSVVATYPPVMLEERIDAMIHDFEHRLQEQRLTIDEYLKLNSISMEELRSDFTEAATTSLKRALILGELLEVEHLEVTDEEIEDEIQTMLLSFGAQAATARQLFSSKETRQSIRNRLLADKAEQRLRAIARGEAPTLDQPAEVEGEKPAKPIRKNSAKSKSKESTAKAEAPTESEPKPRKRKKAAETTSDTEDVES